MRQANRYHVSQLIAVLLWWLPVAVQATGTPIDERRPLAPDGRVSVENIAGRIEVTAWDREEVHLTGKLARQMKPLEVSGDRRHLSILVEKKGDFDHIDDTVLMLKVPAGASLDLQGVSGRIEVRGVRGPVKAQSVSGDVVLETASPAISVSSVSGDLEVTAPSGDTRLDTVSGDIEAAGLTGRVDAESVSGHIRIRARDVAELNAETVSGDVTLDLSLVADGEVDVESLSGDIEVQLPAMAARLDAGTFSGSVDLDEDLGSGSYRGGREYRARHAGGVGQLELRSFSGDVEVRKRRD